MDWTVLLIAGYGYLLIVGTWIAYGMQTFRILYTKSGDGVSPWQPTLNYVGSCLLVMDVIALKGSEWFGPIADDLSPTTILGTAPFFQIAASLPLSVVLLSSLTWATRTTETVICNVTIVLHTLLMVSTLVAVAVLAPAWLEWYGQACGMLASITTTVTWLPEIVLVWRHQSTGELLIAFVLFEFFGSVTTVLYQALPWFGDEPWTAWFPEFILFVQQFILVVLWIRLNKKMIRTIGLGWGWVKSRFAGSEPPADIATVAYELIDYRPPLSDGPDGPYP